MAWKLKKEYENTSISSIRLPLKELTQKQIKKLKQDILDAYFVEDKPKVKKKNDTN
mgnify:CR=1 FL=1|tara:strand:+ start:2276 stop:2443 length:168 start_codon:yes stop_codon:yes gene_type:complete